MTRLLSALTAMVVLATILVVAPESASAQVTPNVFISEIHYHPQSTSVPVFDEREDTEFIEILNREPAAVDLTGWCLEDGIDFCFTAGTSLASDTTLVLAKDAVAFESVHGFMPIDVYEGRLSNSGERVALRANDGSIVAEVTWATSDPWPVLPDGNGPSLELRSTAGDLTSPANWSATLETDGNPGSVPSLINAPVPLVVSHTGAELVNVNQSIPVTATAVNTTAMVLAYEVDWGPTQYISMTESGGQWQGTLPGLGSGGLIQYRFEAQGPGGVTRSPRSDDAVQWWAVGVSTPQPHNTPVIDLFFSPENWENIDNKTCPCTGAVAYEGRIWTNVSARRAGFTSINRPKAHLRLDFPAGSPFEASFLDGPIDELTLDAGFPNYDLVREQLGWQLMEAAGFPVIQTQHVRVHQRGGFQGLYLLREEQDGNWRSRNNLDRGAFYKVESWSPSTFGFRGLWTKKEALNEPDTDIQALAVCVNQTGDALRTCLSDTTDVPQMINEFAAVVAAWQTDQREFNFFVYRDNEQNGLWRMLPDDLDRTFGNHSGGDIISLDPTSGKPYRRCIGTDGTPANEICRAFMNVPEFKEMYLRRIRTLTDELLADPIWSTRVNALQSSLAADWADDDARWNQTNFSFSQIMTALDGFFVDYVAHLRAGGHEGNVPAQQSAAPTVTITGFRSDPGDGLGYVLLTNPSASESVDLSNWTLDGLAEIPEGLVVLPGSTVAVSTNDQLFRAANPAFTGVRATTDGTIAGQVTLVRRDGSVAATVGEVPPAPIVLNEWNAVSSSNVLAGGDPTLGSVVGNGGDWFELVVVQPDLDLRGWRLVMSDNEDAIQAVTDEFVFANDPLLSQLEGGTIITVSESMPDDVTFRPAFGDWHINLQANSLDSGAFFTAASQSNFDTNHRNWQLSIFDDQGALMFGPAGEGIGVATGINSSEIGELQTDPSATVNSLTDFGDGDSSTFGLPNVNGGVVQNLSTLRYPYQRLDADCSGAVDLGDALLIAQFSVGTRTGSNRCPLPSPATQIYVGASDADGNNSVDLGDALLVAQCSVGVTNIGCPD